MKIYTKVVIDMATLATVEEESYEYEGPVALCFEQSDDAADFGGPTGDSADYGGPTGDDPSGGGSEDAFTGGSWTDAALNDFFGDIDTMTVDDFRDQEIGGSMLSNIQMTYDDFQAGTTWGSTVPSADTIAGIRSNYKAGVDDAIISMLASKVPFAGPAIMEAYKNSKIENLAKEQELKNAGMTDQQIAQARSAYYSMTATNDPAKIGGEGGDGNAVLKEYATKLLASGGNPSALNGNLNYANYQTLIGLGAGTSGLTAAGGDGLVDVMPKITNTAAPNRNDFTSDADYLSALRKYATMLEPYRAAGESALSTLTEKINAGPGDYKESPYYQIQLQEGLKALERQLAAQGKSVSGGTGMKAITNYAEDQATKDYDTFLENYYKSLVPYASLANMGQQAATTIGNMGQSEANSLLSGKQWGSTFGLATDQFKADLDKFNISTDLSKQGINMQKDAYDDQKTTNIINSLLNLGNSAYQNYTYQNTMDKFMNLIANKDSGTGNSSSYDWFKDLLG